MRVGPVIVTVFLINMVQQKELFEDHFFVSKEMMKCAIDRI